MRVPTVIATAFALFQLADASTKECTTALNNLQRCFISSSVLASSYCSTYLSIPTITVTATAYATTAVPTIVSTEVDVLISTTLLTTFSTLTSTTTQTTFTTTTATDAASDFVAPQKRATSSVFNCVVSQSPVLYAASSISFACSCLALPTPTITVTATTSTQVNYVPETTTTSTTTLDQIVTTLPQTAIQTNTETDVVTTTTYTAPPTCTPGSTVALDEGVSFVQIFAGSGVSENPDNPSNQATPDVTTFPGSLDGCAAAKACGEFVYNSANNDYNFDLHYLIAEDVWSCTGYYNALSSASDWNVESSDIGASYGYEY